jgi:hypothetical protein
VKTIFILDGYNILHRSPELAALMESSLEQARNALARMCRNWLASRGDAGQFVIVWDNSSGNPGDLDTAGSGIRMVYADPGETADVRIARLAENYSRTAACIVVSDDKGLCRSASGRNIKHMPVCEFFSVSQRGRGASCAKGAEDGKVLPRHSSAITESLRRIWDSPRNADS